MAPVPLGRSKDVLPTTEALRLGAATPHDPIGDTNYAGKGRGRNVEEPSEELLGSTRWPTSLVHQNHSWPSKSFYLSWGHLC